MRRIVLQNSSGFTLVEILIASVVALLVYLALMQTALVGIDAGTRNNLRDEAVSIATQRMEETKAKPFIQVSSDAGAPCGSCPNGFPATGTCVTKDVKNISQFPFCTNLTVTALDSYVNQVTITVGWQWKGNDYTHRIISTMRKT